MASQTSSYRSQLALTQMQADQMNKQAYGNMTNIVMPGLQNYSSLLANLYNPGSVNVAGQKVQDQLDTYNQRTSDMYNNAGYTDAEKNSMRYATDAGIAGAYGGAQQDMEGRAERTNSPAGLSAAEGNLARAKASDTTANRANLEGAFGQARIQGQQNAMQLAQFAPQAQQSYMQGERGAQAGYQFAPSVGTDLYKTNTGATTTLMGNESQATSQYGNQLTQPGFWSRLVTAGVQGASGAVTGGLMKCWIAALVWDEYFEDGPRVSIIREWMGENPSIFTRMYEKYGEQFAKWAERKPLVVKTLRKLFDHVLRKVAS